MAQFYYDQNSIIGTSVEIFDQYYSHENCIKTLTLTFYLNGELVTKSVEFWTYSKTMGISYEVEPLYIINGYLPVPVVFSSTSYIMQNLAVIDPTSYRFGGDTDPVGGMNENIGFMFDYEEYPNQSGLEVFCLVDDMVFKPYMAKYGTYQASYISAVVTSSVTKAMNKSVKYYEKFDFDFSTTPINATMYTETIIVKSSAIGWNFVSQSQASVVLGSYGAVTAMLGSIKNNKSLTIKESGNQITSNIGNVSLYFSYAPNIGGTITVDYSLTTSYELKQISSDFTAYAGIIDYVKPSENIANCFQVIQTKTNGYYTESSVYYDSLEYSKMNFKNTGQNTFNIIYSLSGMMTLTKTCETTVDYKTDIESWQKANENWTIQKEWYYNSVKTVKTTLRKMLDTISLPLTYDDGFVFDMIQMNGGWDSEYKTGGMFDYSFSNIDISGLDTEFSIDDYKDLAITINVSCDEIDIYDGERAFDSFTLIDKTINKYVLSNVPTRFNYNEIYSLGSNVKLDLYRDSELIESVSASNISNYLGLPSGYGNAINDSSNENLLVAGTQSVEMPIYPYGKSYASMFNYTWNYLVYYITNITYSYASTFPKPYYFDESLTSLPFDKSWIENIKATWSDGTTSTISSSEYSVDNELIEQPRLLIEYKFHIDYTSAYGQATDTVVKVNAEAIFPVAMSITKLDTSDYFYYDNGSSKFAKPTNIKLVVQNTDGSKYDITDLSNVKYSLEKNGTFIDETYTMPRKITEIWLYLNEKNTDLWCSYGITPKEDTIKSCVLTNEPTFVLSNAYNTLKELLVLKATYDSGIEKEYSKAQGNLTDVTLYNEYETQYSASARCMDALNSLKVKIGSSSYFSISVSKITFAKPTIDVKNTEMVYTNFPLNYNNNANDYINATEMTMNVHYTDSDYILEEVIFVNTYPTENREFYITLDKSYSDYTSYTALVFDGSEPIALDTIKNVKNYVHLSALFKDYYGQEAEKKFTVAIYQITNITGIQVLQAKTSYYVGDKFLIEDDIPESEQTKIRIFYTGVDGDPDTTDIYLKDDFPAINVSPLKGTELRSLTDARQVTISSASNSGVAYSYTISVIQKSKSSITTVLHNCVLAYDTVTDKYVVIEEFVDNQPTTTIASDGIRMLDIKTSERDNILGYVENLNDEYNNARLILYHDYLPPDAESNIEITYPCYEKENANYINKCKFGILFGNNNANNNLFVSGNEDYVNCDWHSGEISNEYDDNGDKLNGNFGYFEDTDSYCFYGETDNAVVGYSLVSNNKLLVLKNKSDKETTIYFRQPTQVSVTDETGAVATDTNGSTLYKLAFSKVSGNNSVAGISHSAIASLNGDCLFISSENNVVGLDLTGIETDNQRYANTRSYYIDNKLRDLDLSNAWLWTNNKYLFLVTESAIFVTHYETKSSSQYEWFIINITNVTSLIEIGNVIYAGRSDGSLIKINKEYYDFDKIFVPKNGVGLYGYDLDSTSSINEDNKAIIGLAYLNQMEDDKEYTFKVNPTNTSDNGFMYYQFATCDLENNKGDFFVDSEGYLKLKTQSDEGLKIIEYINNGKPVYINHLEALTSINCEDLTSDIRTYYKKYSLVLETENIDFNSPYDRYYLVDYKTKEKITSSIKNLRCAFCMRLDQEYKIVNLNREEQSFQLQEEDTLLNLVKYDNQIHPLSFKAQIISKDIVTSYYITKPYDMGALGYFKTIWNWSLTNDTNYASDLDIAVVHNAIAYFDEKTLNSLVPTTKTMSFNSLSFNAITFKNSILPQTYTNSRIMSQLQYVCFGFRSTKPENSVLCQMQLTYTIAYPSYGRG